MNEWSFVTAHVDGVILTMDGRMRDDTVQNICKTEGWEIEHSAFDNLAPPVVWRLILSRPMPNPNYQPAFNFATITDAPEAKLYDGVIERESGATV